MADTIAVMNGGKIEQIGSPTELYERPRTAFVAGFLGKSNLLPGLVAEAGCVRLDNGTEVRIDGAEPGKRIAIGVRPEKLRIGGSGVNRVAGTVRETAYIGVATEIVVDTHLGMLTVFQQNLDGGASVPAHGADVTVTWEPDAAFVIHEQEETR